MLFPLHRLPFLKFPAILSRNPPPVWFTGSRSGKQMWFSKDNVVPLKSRLAAALVGQVRRLIHKTDQGRTTLEIVL